MGEQRGEREHRVGLLIQMDVPLWQALSREAKRRGIGHEELAKEVLTACLMGADGQRDQDA